MRQKEQAQQHKPYMGASGTIMSWHKLWIAGLLVLFLSQSATASILFEDYFDEANGKSTNWTNITGGFLVIANSLNTTTTSSSLAIPSNTSFYNWTNYILNVSLRRNGGVAASGYSMIYFRVQNQSNRWGLVLLVRQVSGELDLYTRTTTGYGNLFLLSNNNIIAADNNYNNLSIYTSGSIFKLLYNGTQILYSEIPDGFANGTIGLGTTTWGSDFDNVIVSDWNESFITELSFNRTYFYSPQNVSIQFRADTFDTSIPFWINVTLPDGTIYSKQFSNTLNLERKTFVYPADFSAPAITTKGKYNVTINQSGTSLKTGYFEYKNTPTLSFVVMSDIHYNMAIAGKKVKNETMIHLTNDINQSTWFPSPDFIAIVGDSTEDSTALPELKTYLDLFNVPYNIAPAGHEGISEATGSKGWNFYQSFGVKYNYTSSVKGSSFIYAGTQLDNVTLTSGLAVGTIGMVPNYLTWLNSSLVSAWNTPAFVFSHELAQEPRTGGGGQAYWETTTPGIKTRASLVQYNNVVAQFGGHGHLITRNQTGNITYIMDGAVTNVPLAYRYVELYPDHMDVHTVNYLSNRSTSNTILAGYFFYPYWNPSSDATHNLENYNTGIDTERDFSISFINISATTITNLYNFSITGGVLPRLIFGNNTVFPDKITGNFTPYQSYTLLNGTISASSDNVTVNISAWNTSYKKWNESSSNASVTTQHIIGDFTPNTQIQIKKNGANWNQYTSNSTGYISFTYSDGYSDIQFEAQNASTAFNTITFPANSWGMFNNWSSNLTFSQIATNESNDVAYTWYNTTSGDWEDLYVGQTYNQNNVIPYWNSVLGYFNAQTTITATVITPANTGLTAGWNMLYVEGGTNRTLSEIQTNIALSCTVNDLYKWNTTTNDYDNTGTSVVQPNEGFIVDVAANCNWVRTTI